MIDTIKGVFTLTLRGVPFLMWGHIKLTAGATKERAEAHALIVGPFMIGLAFPVKSRNTSRGKEMW